MTPTPRPLLTIPDDAKDALSPEKFEAAKKTDEEIRREIAGRNLIAQVCAQHVRDKVFGPGWSPTLKQRLLMWSSHNVIKTVWASERYVERISHGTG